MESNRQDRRSSCACLLSLSLILAAVTPTSATAVTFQVEITDAIYQVQAADTYADLLLQHQAGNLLSSNSLTGVSGITAPIEAGVNTDYSMLITTTLNIAVGVPTSSRLSPTGGGAASVIYNGNGSVVSEYVTTSNVWWNNDWNDADVFSTIVTLGAGSSYTLGWLGFEDCCGGSASIRFSYNGGAFTTLTESGIAPFVSNPEPSTGLMVALGLVLMSGARRRRGPNTHRRGSRVYAGLSTR